MLAQNEEWKASFMLEMHCAYALGASGMHRDDAIRELLKKGEALLLREKGGDEGRSFWQLG